MGKVISVTISSSLACWTFSVKNFLLHCTFNFFESHRLLLFPSGYFPCYHLLLKLSSTERVKLASTLIALGLFVLIFVMGRGDTRLNLQSYALIYFLLDCGGEDIFTVWKSICFEIVSFGLYCLYNKQHENICLFALFLFF